MTRALLIDDEEDIREIARTALELAGFDVVTAASVTEGLEEARRAPPDIVLLDVMLPGVDGPTGFGLLRELPGLEAVPIAFVTAKVMPEEVARLEALGAAAVIAKPFDPLDLGSRVEALVKSASRSSAEARVLDAIGRLRAQFIARLGDRLARIDRAAEVAIASPRSPAAAHDVHQLAHTLAGTAATYQLDAVADGARLVEALCQGNLADQQHAEALTQALATLRRAVADVTPADGPAPPPPPPANPPSSNAQRLPDRVVVVDDDHDHLSWLAEGLRNLGFLVETAIDVSLIDHLLGDGSIAAIVMDIIFAEDRDGGLRWVKQRRAEGRLPCPVVFVSARSDFDARLEAFRCGADGYCVKPVQIVELSDTLRRLIASRQPPSPQVLLVDDDPDMLAFCRTVLESTGARVHAVQEPANALAYIESAVPDVIVLDVNMPGCNGFELAGVIRQKGPDFVHVPIIFLTAEHGAESRLRAAESASDDFLTKPVAPDLLAASVRSRTRRARKLGGVLAHSRSSDNRVASITQHANDAIVAVDSNGVILSFNPAAERLFAYSAADALGRPVTMLVPPQHRAAHSEAFRRVMRGGVPRHTGRVIEVPVLRSDGAEVPTELSLSLYGPPLARSAIAIIRDITDRKRAEASIREAKEQAEAANRSKSDFLTSMSHELRTPLNAILGFAQLFGIDPSLSEESRENAREIERAGQHLLSLVNDVIDLARIEGGHLDIERRPLALAPTLRDCVALVSPLASTRHVEIVLPPIAERLAVEADAARLRQVLINLLSNAIKYNRPRGLVHLSVEPLGPTVRISVRDTGEGIPEDRRTRLFHPFDRLGQETSAIEGTGIGLVLTRRLVEAMGGSLGFSSETGVGTTFWVDLCSAPLAADQAGSARAPSDSTTQRPAARPIVLCIEDNVINLRLMQHIFARRPGLELRDAPSAELGLALARALRPALILMDINLPGIDGLTAVRQLKASPDTAALPVFAVSSNAMRGDQERAIEAGCEGYLTKPIDVRAFLAWLDERFDNPPR